MTKKIEHPVLDITVDGLKDFQMCALLYDFRHQQKRYESIPRSEELALRYENIMMKIVSFFFYKKQSGVVPSVSALLNRWEKHWFPKDMTSYDIAIEQHDVSGGNLSSYSTEATRSLLGFYEDFAKDIESDPLLIDEEFIIPIGSDVRLMGTFDLVLRDKKNVHTVIKWVTNTKRIPVSSMVLDFAALKMALDYRNDRKPMVVRYGYYDLVSTSKFGFKPTEVPEVDINALLYWVDEANKTQLFMPRRGLANYCRYCPYDTPCRDFEVTEQMLQVAK